jgi:hypothetical protein
LRDLQAHDSVATHGEAIGQIHLAAGKFALQMGVHIMALRTVNLAERFRSDDRNGELESGGDIFAADRQCAQPTSRRAGSKPKGSRTGGFRPLMTISVSADAVVGANVTPSIA